MNEIQEQQFVRTMANCGSFYKEPLNMFAIHSTRYDELNTASSFSPSVTATAPIAATRHQSDAPVNMCMHQKRPSVAVAGGGGGARASGGQGRAEGALPDPPTMAAGVYILTNWLTLDEVMCFQLSPLSGQQSLCRPLCPQKKKICSAQRRSEVWWPV